MSSSAGLPPLSAIASGNMTAPAFPSASTSASASASASAAFLGPGHGSGIGLVSIGYRYARIKDPVPRKLKIQGGQIKGNFSVMQLDLAGHDSSLERDELAKRASESTEMAAMRAYQSGVGFPSAKRFVRLPDDSNIWSSCSVPAASSASASASAAAVASMTAGAVHTTQAEAVASAVPFAPPDSSAPSAPPETMPRQPSSLVQSQPLSPDETKKERDRLLALLQSLSPTAIVDQICKALAYFGGDSGAAPPIGDLFPTSEQANGNGSLFIGWISEIFPKSPDKALHMSQTSRWAHTLAVEPSNGISAAGAAARTGTTGTTAETVEHPSALHSYADAPADTVEKRRRGRPKGSKASKVRKDKGIKKGPTKMRKASLAGATASVGASASADMLQNGQTASRDAVRPADDEGWVDVDDSVLDASNGVADGLFFGSVAPNTATVASTPDAAGLHGMPGSASQLSGNIAERGKKRGRPKGSRNRPKAPVAADLPSTEVTENIGTTETTDTTAVSTTSHASHLADGFGPTAFSGTPGITSIAGLPSPTKKPYGHPKSSAFQPRQSQGQQESSRVGNGHDVSVDHLRKAYDVSPQPLMPAMDAAAAVSGSKRKRAKPSKTDHASAVRAEAYSPNGMYTTAAAGLGNSLSQPSDLLIPGDASPVKRPRKATDAKTAFHNSIASSASPALSTSASQVSSLGTPTDPLGGDVQILSSLNNHGSDSHFTLSTLESLSSNLAHDTAASLMSRPIHHLSHQQESHSQQQQQQHNQQRQQQQQQQQQHQKQQLQQQQQQRQQQEHQQEQEERQQQQQQQQQQQHWQRQQYQAQHQQSQYSHTIFHQSHDHRSATQTAIPALAQHSSQGQVACQIPPTFSPQEQLPQSGKASKSFYSTNRQASASFGQPQPSQHQQITQMPPAQAPPPMSRSHPPLQQQQPQPQPQKQSQRQQQQQQQHHHHQQQQQQQQHFAASYQSHGSYPSPQHTQDFVNHDRQSSAQSISASNTPSLMASKGLLRSPQFGTASSTPNLGASSNGYGTSPAASSMSFSPSSFAKPHRSTAASSPSLSSHYGLATITASSRGPHGMSHHHGGSPSFPTSRPQLSPVMPPSSQQNVASSAAATAVTVAAAADHGLHGFNSFDNQSLFDSMASMDAAAASDSSGLGLASAAGAYSLGGAVPRTSTSSGGYADSSTAAAAVLNSFGPAISGGNMKDRLFGVRR